MAKNKIIIIAGPTASGKSGAAINISEIINGEIIGADSMQIYKGLDIGTAKVTEKECRGIKHHMIDIVEPSETFSVSEYSAMAESCIADVISRGKIPVLTGGTGLYIDSVIYNFGFGVEKDEKLRETLNKVYDADDGSALYEKMKCLDPLDTEKYHKNNKHRLIRAVEIFTLTGKTKTQLKDSKELKYDINAVVIESSREELYKNIDDRVDKIFDMGIIGEINGLLNDGITFDMQSMQAIGYKEFKEYFEKNKNIEQVKENIKLNTRHYAKRQITWFKKYDFAQKLTIDEICPHFKDYK